MSALRGNKTLLNHLAGIQVLASEYLAYDEMYVGDRGLVVGEAAHLIYRMKMIDLNNECRAAARRHIETRARHILGEDWKVS